MRKRSWSKWATLLGSGAILLQPLSCAEAATVMNSFYTWITAGGVMYIVSRILD